MSLFWQNAFFSYLNPTSYLNQSLLKHLTASTENKYVQYFVFVLSAFLWWCSLLLNYPFLPFFPSSCLYLWHFVLFFSFCFIFTISYTFNIMFTKIMSLWFFTDVGFITTFIYTFDCCLPPLCECSLFSFYPTK